MSVTSPSSVHPTAEVDAQVVLRQGVHVWQHSHIRSGAVIGEDTNVGRCVYVGTGVRIGARCKIQNNAQIYEPATLADGVFIGPGVILTNDRNPRAVNPDLTKRSADDWDPVGVTVREGASIGAGAVCVAPVVIGRWALVAAGAVVTADVPDFGLVAGVPARQIGWVGRSGRRLEASAADPSVLLCPQTNDAYRLQPDGMLAEVMTP